MDMCERAGEEKRFNLDIFKTVFETIFRIVNCLLPAGFIYNVPFLGGYE
jgi:hypothetical protein